MSLHRFFRDFVLNNKRLKDSMIVNLLYLLYEFTRHYISSGFKYYKVGRLSSLKRSDTLVILGAGSTINDLSESQINELNEYDVAGLSYSCVFPVSQNFYFYESPSKHEEDLMLEHANKVVPAVIKNNEKKQLKHLIWKNSENKVFNKHIDSKKFLCVNVCTILSDNSEVIKKIINFCSKTGINRYFLVQKRGSVVALLQFALLLRYKEIIFVGVDLNGGKYFFEDNKKYNKYNFLDPYSFGDVYSDKDVIHRTNNASIGIPIIDVLKIFFESASGVRFYVSSRKSALVSYIPLWQWQDE